LKNKKKTENPEAAAKKKTSAAAADESRSGIKIFPKFLGINGNDAKFFGA
jgi:hypothetical protein